MLPAMGDGRSRRRVSLELVRDRAHYDVVVAGAIARARTSVWIATANLKDVHVEAPVGTRARARGRYVSALELFGDLARRGVEVRILHGGEPSRPFQESLRRGGGAARIGLALRRCPRVHLKMIAVDGAFLYLGSANFTGAGLGAKSEVRRNFEAGVATDDELLLDEMQGVFDRIWSGGECGGCSVRRLCPAPLDRPPPAARPAAPAVAPARAGAPARARGRSR
jgi:phosphatidylserine/phosphatidylglycerophosphate/cardiolipin synthase-like enzyme